AWRKQHPGNRVAQNPWYGHAQEGRRLPRGRGEERRLPPPPAPLRPTALCPACPAPRLQPPAPHRTALRPLAVDDPRSGWSQYISTDERIPGRDAGGIAGAGE